MKNQVLLMLFSIAFSTLGFSQIRLDNRTVQQLNRILNL